MASPNIVLEGRGRFVWQRVFTREQMDDENKSKVNVLDGNKVGARVSMIPGENESSLVETMEALIFNDDDTEQTVAVSFTTLLSTGVTAVVKYGGQAKTSPFNVTVPAFGSVSVTVEYTVATTAVQCTLSGVYFNILLSGSELDEDKDSGALVLYTQGCSVSDIMTQYEGIITDLSIFKETDDTTIAEAVNDYIKSATEEAACFINPLWRKSIGCTQTVKQFCILTVMRFALLKLCMASGTGAQLWSGSLQVVRDELKALEGKIINYN